MNIAVADSAKIDDVLPLVSAYDVGIEVQEFALPENLDGWAAGDRLTHDLAAKMAPVSLRALHGPFMELIPASRDRLGQDVARTRFESAYKAAMTVDVQHLILHTGYFPKTYPHDKWIANSAAFWSDFLADKTGPKRIYLENIYEDDFRIIVEPVERINEALGREALSKCGVCGGARLTSPRSSICC